MNCTEMQTWMLDSETPALPPPPMVEHLRACGTCRQIQAQLVHIEGQLYSSPLPAMPAHLRASLMEDIAIGPAVRPAFRRGRRRWRLEHIVGYAMAAAASVVLGIVVGYAASERNRIGTPVVNAPTTSSTANVVAAPDEELLVGPEVLTPPEEGPAPSVVDLAEDIAPPTFPMPVEPVRPIPAPEIDMTQPMPMVAARLLSDEELLASLVTQHTQAAQANTPQDRLAQLSALSDLLWGQFLAESEPGASSGNLEWLDATLISLAENDFPALARSLPASQADHVQSLASRLEERSREAEQLASKTSTTGVVALAQMAKAWKEGSRKVTSKGRESSPGRPRREVDAVGLMPLIVEQTIGVVREENPVERAECSSVVAEGLSKDILMTALRGDERYAGQLGMHFGRVLEQGVAVNLQRVDTAKASYQQSRRYQQVLARTQQSVMLLYQSLEAAPPDARLALEAALVSGGMAKPMGTRRSWRWVPGNIRIFVIPNRP